MAATRVWNHRQAYGVPARWNVNQLLCLLLIGLPPDLDPRPPDLADGVEAVAEGVTCELRTLLDGPQLQALQVQMGEEQAEQHQSSHQESQQDWPVAAALNSQYVEHACHEKPGAPKAAGQDVEVAVGELVTMAVAGEPPFKSLPPVSEAHPPAPPGCGFAATAPDGRRLVGAPPRPQTQPGRAPG